MKVYHEHTEAIDNHLDQFFKKKEIVVFHELLSLDLHVDVYLITPKKANHQILLTSGRSAYAMKAPHNNQKFAELMMLIPPDVDFGKIYPSKSKHDWMIAALKAAVRIPYHNNSWIGKGHTLQHDADFNPYSRHTKFCGGMIIPSFVYDTDFTRIKVSPRREINIYSFFPLYKEELQYKLKHGYSQFLELLADNDANEVLNLKRKNVCKK